MKARALFSGAVATLAATFWIGSTLSAQPPPSASAWDGVYTDEQASRGDALYLKVCVSCHGPTLEGGEMAPGLADGAFKANWNGLTMGDLYDRIHESMPPDDPGRLSRQETADVLARLLSANKFPAGEKELPGRPEMLRLILFDPFR
jgi:mono/diheme cytochrome c family protein